MPGLPGGSSPARTAGKAGRWRRVACLLAAAGAQAPAAVPAAVTDTTALGFMRWYLRPQSSPGKWRSLTRHTVPWRDVYTSIGGDAPDFAHKLWFIHQADTTAYTPAELRRYRVYWKKTQLPADFFSSADLAALRRQYARETPLSWLASVSRLKLTDKGPPRSAYYRAFALPLFSLDGQHALVWEYKGCKGMYASWSLLAFERPAGGNWRLARFLDGEVE